MDFDLHIGIDYSGAETPTSRLSALRVYVTQSGTTQPVTTPAAPIGRHWNWTRQEIAEWLIDQARSSLRFIAGIDHGFSFPISYFQKYNLDSWSQFLEDFAGHWPTHAPETRVESILKDNVRPPHRTGCSKELRLTEKWTSSAKSVFRFGMQGSVAKSTHAGLPWLLRIRQEVGDRIHFWPFDGWATPADKSIFVEVYPSIFRNRYAREGRSTDEQDAYATARWLTEMQERGALDRYFEPPLTEAERGISSLEGWIFGIL